MLARLERLSAPPDLPECIPITRGRLTLGRRKKGVDVTLDSKSIPNVLSRTHARIYLVSDPSDEWWIEDENSVNGTFVNKKRIQKQKINNGDVITFGGGANVLLNASFEENAFGFHYRFSLTLDELTLQPESHVYSQLSLSSNSSSGFIDTSTNRSFGTPSKKRKLSPNKSSPISLSSSSAYSSNMTVSPIKYFSQSQQPLQPRLNLQTFVVELENTIKSLEDQYTSSERLYHERENMLMEDLRSQDLRRVVLEETLVKAVDKNTLLEKRHEDSMKELDKLKYSLQQILEGFSCSICSDVLFRTITLECSHSFCEACFEKWKLTRQDCPICRQLSVKPPIRSLLIDHTIQHAVDRLDTLEAKIYKERSAKYHTFLKREDSDIKRLQSALSKAKKTGHQFLRISEPWREDEKQTFSLGVMDLNGRARVLYCECVGLTEEYISSSNITQLRTSAHNVCLQGLNQNNPHALKRALLDFLKELPTRVLPVYMPP